jgi:hypothetical protein
MPPPWFTPKVDDTVARTFGVESILQFACGRAAWPGPIALLAAILASALEDAGLLPSRAALPRTATAYARQVARRDHRRRTVALAWLLGQLDGTVQVPRDRPPASPASSRRSRRSPRSPARGSGAQRSCVDCASGSTSSLPSAASATARHCVSRARAPAARGVVIAGILRDFPPLTSVSISEHAAVERRNQSADWNGHRGARR